MSRGSAPTFAIAPRAALMPRSIGEIAANAPSVEPGTVYRAFDRAGLAEPAVSMKEGILRLMIRSKEHGKVLSLDVAFAFTPDKMLHVRLDGARIGRLALPDFVVQDRLDQLKAMLPVRENEKGETEHAGENGVTGLLSEDLGILLGRVFSAIDREPIPTELTWPVKEKRVRIEAVEITGGVLRLYVVPIDRKLRSS